MINISVYADTSVFGGIYDDDFQDESKEFFEEVKRGRFTLITSAVVRAEIEPAPEKVKNYFNDMLEFAEIVDVSKEALQLRDAYLKAGIVPPKYSNDALHVALASVSTCSLIVSWNFKHIVHFEKIPLY
ncbi:MAG: type II toxin-antitoxin system VapC family toxin, partial [Nitrosopumilus sp.]